MTITQFLHRVFSRMEDRQQTKTQIDHIMTALESLNASVTKLQASVDAAVTAINTPHPTDAQVQAAADAVTAQSVRLDAAVNPPAPEPATP